MNNFPSVTEILKSEGFIDTQWFDDYSRTRGSYIHLAIHLYDTGDLDEENLDPVIAPYLEAWKKFLAESKFEDIDSEVRLYSETYRLTGMPDKVGLLNGKPTILDNKSGAIAPWTALQLAFYELLSGSPHKRVAVQLKNNGTYSLKEFKDRQDRGTVLSILNVYHWKQNNLKGGDKEADCGTTSNRGHGQRKNVSADYR